MCAYEECITKTVKAMGKAMKRMWLWTLLLWAAVICLLMLAGCRSVRYVPVETVRSDTVYRDRVERDSVVRYDSVYVRDKGDTVWLERYKYVYRDKWRTDTLYVGRSDTVRVPYPVERELSRWERVKMDAGGVAIGALVLALAVTIAYIVRKLRIKN